MKILEYNSAKMITLSNWNTLVKHVYQRPYNFQQQDGCQDRKLYHITIPRLAEDYENDTVPEVVNSNEIGVSFKAWLERDPAQKLNSCDEWDRNYGLNLWWERNFYPDIQMVANDLCEKGFIEPGDYIINIDW